MNSTLTTLLADPKVLAALFSALGGAVAWLWKQMRKNRAEHTQCVVELARMEACRVADREEIVRLTGSVNTLTSLLRKEINLG